MRLHMATRHALFAILELAAQPERQMSAGEIALKYGISPNHLAKVLHTLGREGLVEAARGVGGGYRFAGNAKRTNLLDIIRIFEPAGTLQSAEREANGATSEEHSLRLVLDEIDDTARATLSSISLETMLKLVSRTARARKANDAT